MDEIQIGGLTIKIRASDKVPPGVIAFCDPGEIMDIRFTSTRDDDQTLFTPHVAWKRKPRVLAVLKVDTECKEG